MSECIAALATAVGKASLCSVRISGDGAIEVAKKVFVPLNPAKDLEKMPGYSALLGKFYRRGREMDQAVALVFRRPKSYTGEDVVEISCHGGTAAADRLLKACFEAGATPAPRGEFTKRAFLNGKMDLTRAEAVMEVVNAGSARALAAANSALEGHLYRRICKVRDCLLSLAGHISAYTDFPEEAVEEVTRDQVEETLRKAAEELEDLCRSYDNGQIVKNGVRTAIVGRPNVGKSTFLNGISGFEKAIVTPIPGTTRDVVETEVSIGGVEFILQDTAGIRQTDDEVETLGIERSLKSLDRADLVFRVFDGSRPFTRDDLEVAEKCRGRRAIGVINKQDLPQAADPAGISGCFEKIIYITAKEFKPDARFEKTVLDFLGVADYSENAGAIVNERQHRAARDALSRTKDALDAFLRGYSLDIVGVCVDEALYSIYSLTGENVSDRVVDDVFSKFCVGK